MILKMRVIETLIYLFLSEQTIIIKLEKIFLYKFDYLFCFSNEPIKKKKIYNWTSGVQLFDQRSS